MGVVTGILAGGDPEHVYEAVEVQPADNKVAIDRLR